MGDSTLELKPSLLKSKQDFKPEQRDACIQPMPDFLGPPHLPEEPYAPYLTTLPLCYLLGFQLWGTEAERVAC